MASSIEIKLPDFLSMCKIELSVNPHLVEAGAQSKAWFDKYSVFKSRKRAFFEASNFELLVADLYPYAGFEEYRTGCDLFNLLFSLDELSDDQVGVDARKTMEIHHRIMSGEPCDGSVVSRMTSDVRNRIIAGNRFGPSSLRRFIDGCKGYCDAVGREAEIREHDEDLSIEEYKVFRRQFSGIIYCINFIEFCLGTDLPDTVFANPVFDRMVNSTSDLLGWSNDIYSYRMEKAKGHLATNLVTLAEREKNLSLQEAFDFVGREFEATLSQFMADKENLRSFGEKVDADIQQFVGGLEKFIIGNLEWCLDSQRYFGTEGEKIRETLVIQI